MSTITIGKSTNTSDNYLYGLIASDGITSYGNNLFLQGSYTTSANSGDIQLFASNRIDSDAALTFTTGSGGKVWLISDTDFTNGGTIYIPHDLTINSNGGEIRLAGGNLNGTGFAKGSDASYAEGIDLRGNLNFDSSGGNIILKGKSFSGSISNSNGAFGVGLWNSTNKTIDAGTGTIYFEGISLGNNNSSYNYGVSLTGTTVHLTSANTNSDAITIIGKNTSGQPEGVATNSYGIGVHFDATTSIYATALGGGITIQGGGKDTFQIDEDTEILAVSGDVNFKGLVEGLLDINSAYLYLGSRAGSGKINSSSSNITLNTYSNSWGSYEPSFATTGEVTINPIVGSNKMNGSSSSTPYIESSWFKFNQNNQVMSGLYLGNSDTTSDIYIDEDAITVNGPFSVQAENIFVKSNITTTADSGNIKVLANDDVEITAGVTLTTSGSSGDVILASDKDNSGGGAITALGALTIYQQR
jgi:hypothetical protein